MQRVLLLAAFLMVPALVAAWREQLKILLSKGMRAQAAQAQHAHDPDQRPDAVLHDDGAVSVMAPSVPTVAFSSLGAT